MATIGIIGDIHGEWSEADQTYFDGSGYDLLLFTGDLAPLFRPGSARLIAQMMAAIETPALFVPGNHDIHNRVQLLAELAGWQWLARISGRWHADHHRQLEAWMAPVTVGGYSSHDYRVGGVSFSVVVGRPYAMGGSTLSYRHGLRDLYGVQDGEESSARLRRCVDEAGERRLLFLAHNGPAGLGEEPDAIWGRDFGPEEGDWGDQDLRDGIAYALERGRQVDAVIAGHMHIRTRQGAERDWHVERDGTHYINAARVPRVRKKGRHHVRLELLEGGVEVSERWV